MTDVFVSYKRENLAAVNRLVEALRAGGVSVWWDQDIPPNAPWEATIERELAAAKLVIVAWSPASVASDNVKAEARWARGQGRLLQVFVEACEPPLFFGERQGVDLTGWSGGATNSAFRSLLQAVRAGPTHPPDETASGAPPVAEPTPLPLPGKPSIAVMPFSNLSGDPEQDYFADGMVAEITTALSRIRSIFVIASGSTLSFKGKAVSPQEAGQRLGVRFVLEGSVRKAGNRVRIAVQLIDATEGAQIWAERFDDTLEDIFDLQDKVALAVASKIEPTVMRAEIERVARRPTTNMGSYDLTLRATALVFTFGRDGILQARVLLDRAIALDPDFGQALAVGAFAYAQMARNLWSDDVRTDLRTARDLARRAVDVAPDDPVVLTIVAEALVVIGERLETARGLVDRSLAINPGNSFAWFSSGWMCVIAGDNDLGVERLETSMRLDPLSVLRAFQLSFLGVARFNQRRLTEAAALLEQATQLNPAYIVAQSALAACYGYLGQTAAARATLERRAGLTGQTIEAFASLVFRDPTQRQYYLDGVALAEGKSPADGPVVAG